MKYLSIIDSENENTLGQVTILEDGSLDQQLKSLTLSVSRGVNYLYAKEFQKIVLEPLTEWNQLVVQFLCSINPDYAILISER